MSNLWFNLRIWRFHIQIRDGEWRPRISYNDYYEKWTWLMRGPEPRPSMICLCEYRPPWRADVVA